MKKNIYPHPWRQKAMRIIAFSQLIFAKTIIYLLLETMLIKIMWQICVGGKPVEIQLFNFEFPLRGTRADVRMENSRAQNSYGAMCTYRWNSSQWFRLCFWFVFHNRRPSLTRTASSGATASWSGAAKGVILVNCRLVVDDCWCLAHLADVGFTSVWYFRIDGTQKKSCERNLILANCSILGSLLITPPWLSSRWTSLLLRGTAPALHTLRVWI